MYDMYPDWGPAKHRRDDADQDGRGSYRSASATTVDLRDGGGQRPDDN